MSAQLLALARSPDIVEGTHDVVPNEFVTRLANIENELRLRVQLRAEIDQKFDIRLKELDDKLDLLINRASERTGAEKFVKTIAYGLTTIGAAGLGAWLSSRFSIKP